MKTLLSMLFVFSLNSYSMECSKHPIYCQIIKNKTLKSGAVLIDKEYAMKLSNVIYKMHKKYHIPSRIFTAMLMQESGYRLDNANCKKGMIKKNDRITNEKGEVCMDFGVSMINEYHTSLNTKSKHKFDIHRLLTDLEYSIEAGAIILADFMERYEAKDNYWWLRYNCGEKGSTNRVTCQEYKRKVERYL